MPTLPTHFARRAPDGWAWPCMGMGEERNKALAGAASGAGGEPGCGRRTDGQRGSRAARALHACRAPVRRSLPLTGPWWRPACQWRRPGVPVAPWAPVSPSSALPPLPTNTTPSTPLLGVRPGQGRRHYPTSSQPRPGTHPRYPRICPPAVGRTRRRAHHRRRPAGCRRRPGCLRYRRPDPPALGGRGGGRAIGVRPRRGWCGRRRRRRARLHCRPRRRPARPGKGRK